MPITAREGKAGGVDVHVVLLGRPCDRRDLGRLLRLFYASRHLTIRHRGVSVAVRARRLGSGAREKLLRAAAMRFMMQAAKLSRERGAGA